MASSAKIACGVDKPSVSHSRTTMYGERSRTVKQEVNSEFKQLSIFEATEPCRSDVA
ncbi:MAG: hypothetical protein HC916_11180 [Coleofasciculaceae cyanobacterium SM2_1_6]|nr:hypothetical protein [Coleofasciculaceae cyanobacterium SM2_1_6]